MCALAQPVLCTTSNQRGEWCSVTAQRRKSWFHEFKLFILKSTWYLVENYRPLKSNLSLHLISNITEHRNHNICIRYSNSCIDFVLHCFPQGRIKTEKSIIHKLSDLFFKKDSTCTSTSLQNLVLWRISSTLDS